MTRHPLSRLPMVRRSGRFPILLLAALALQGFLPASPNLPFDPPLLWPENQRAFLQDGPGLLLSTGTIDDLLGRDAVGREELIVRYLAADPVPETPVNELDEGIARRRALALSEIGTFLDDRAKLLFLHGEPKAREAIDCAETFKPLEVWTYPEGETDRDLVLYQPKPDQAWRLWLPIDSKRELYNPEMEYWLEQWEELKHRISGGKRFDRVICKSSKRIDEITGVEGLFGFLEDRPRNEVIKAYLQPPDDLAAWARAAAAGPAAPAPLAAEPELQVVFPDRQGQRMRTQMLVKVPPEVALQPFVEGDTQELRLTVEGRVEYRGQPFDAFRLRYQMAPPEEGVPIALMIERRLRPDQRFLVRLRVVDEISGLAFHLDKGFEVPTTPTPPADLPPVPAAVIQAIEEKLDQHPVGGYDSLILVPPESDVVFGLWRAEALVTGSKIQEVVFFLDGQEVLKRRTPPFSAELRLATYPVEQVVRAEGRDAEGGLVAADEVIVNQPRGELRVRILAPERGRAATGAVTAKAEVVVPEEQTVRQVTFSVNEQLQATVEKPPWQARIEVPAGGEVSYLTVVAELENGARAEDVRFLNSPEFLEQVDVNLVELYTTVTDNSSRLVEGLVAGDFQVWEDGRPQKISKFELVENLPLTLGIVIDTSGSMFESLGEAQRAAVGFLENIITPRDRCFALAFSDRPELLMERTSDVGAVAQQLEHLVANGATSLHDAIVTALYYYRGIRGRRAMVLLSDGEDTSSSLGFKEALEYAKISGVAIYTIGLRIGKLDVGVRNKLENLSQETGGRTFYIKEAADLAGIYGEIEKELRSQYLVAYNSDQPGTEGRYHEVAVKVRGGKLKARTIRGYYD